MASTRTRQRKIERDRYQRKLVRRAQKQRRRRQIQAGVGAFLALALIGLGTAWLAGAFESDEPGSSFTQPDLCTWLPRDASDPNRVEAGRPPTNPPTRGMHRITMELDAGPSGGGTLEVIMDVNDDPCGAASLRHLADQGFYDGTVCHEIVDGALHCGDPSGTGLGGPDYAFWAENLPLPAESADGEDAPPLYPAGTVAFADAAGENGSRFMIFFEDFSPSAPLYPIIGTLTSGLDVVTQIGEAGTVEGTNTPVNEVVLRSFTVTDAAEPPVR